ncbi:MAG: protein kinase [Blastocatellia bacterium]
MLVNNRFEVEKELGRGGIGVVYKAFDKENNNKVVVIKVLIDKPDNNSSSNQWLETHFFKEAKALKTIDHPGVVQLIDSGETVEGKAFFAMEYIEGCDLRSQIDPKRGLIGDYERVATIIRQLGDAISAAHEKGIYHRDLKPENIMLQKVNKLDDEQVKVIDFGIATVKDSYDEKTKTTQLLAGSINYMSPEQLENKPSAASDIYALGIIAYEMVTGRLPFNPEGDSYMVMVVQLMLMQREGVRIKPKDLRPSLSPVAQAIILKALSFDANDRYKSAREFGNLLAESLVSLGTMPLQKLDTNLAAFVNGENKDADVSNRQTNQIANKITNTVKAATTEKEPQVKLPDNGVNNSSQKRTYMLVISAIVVIGLISSLGLYWSRTSVETTNSVLSTPTPIVKENIINYWGMLQNYDQKTLKPKGESLRLASIAGETYFNTGDGIKFFVKPAQDGYIYILAEELNPNNITQYAMLFPTPSAKPDSSKIVSSQEVTTGEIVFQGQAGTEKVWIIWSATEIKKLEEAFVKWGNKEFQGEIKDPTYVSSIKKLIDSTSSQKLAVEKDDDNDYVRLKSSQNVIAYLLKLKHVN